MIVWYEYDGDWCQCPLHRSFCRSEGTFFESLESKPSKPEHHLHSAAWTIKFEKYEEKMISLCEIQVYLKTNSNMWLLEPLEQLAHVHSHISNRLFFKKKKIS